MLSRYVKRMQTEFHGYNLNRLIGDLMAGLTVCAVALPLALAFGVSCGATAAAGLITAIIAGIVISALSGASYQISGPTGAMSAVLITIVAKDGGQLNGVFLVSLMAGIVLLVLGVFKLGRLVSVIPHPVIVGFTSGIAIIIAMGQIDNFFGTTSSGTSIIEKLASYGKNGFVPYMPSMLIGLFVVAVMILWPKKWNAKVPSSLVAIILAAIVSAVFSLDVAQVGEIPKTLLPPNRLDLSSLDFKAIPSYFSAAITVAALGMIESLLCGASASNMKNESFDADIELVGQGIGNILIPFFGGVPATAAIARTSVAIKSGGQTRLTGVFHAMFLLASMFLLGGVMSQLPMAALAGVLMVTAFRMNEWSEIKSMFKMGFKSEILQYSVTMLATVVFDLTVAIIIGIVFSLLAFLSKAIDIDVNFSRVESDRMPEVDVANCKHTVVVYITGAVFFANFEKLQSELKEMPKSRCIIFSMRGVSVIDATAAKSFLGILESYRNEGKEILLCGVNPNVKTILDRAGVDEILGEN
ncbi:MAG: SulP family inorganic anion transporter, partial [Oscillospiraceae bacterium]|nr:SulP family inorganic anion transporter [Oscillospiraceae bacterium]